MSGSSDSTNAPLGSKSRKLRAWFNLFWQPADYCQSKLRKRSTEFSSRAAIQRHLRFPFPGGCSIAKSIQLRCVAITLQARSVDPQQMACPVLVQRIYFGYGERQPRSDAEGNASASSADKLNGLRLCTQVCLPCPLVWAWLQGNSRARRLRSAVPVRRISVFPRRLAA